MNLFERTHVHADGEHPSVEQLNAFVLGHLGDDDSTQIEHHLSTCPVCSTLTETAPDDALVTLFRQAHSLAAAGRFAVPASTEKYEFLAPAQRPDELGRLGSYRVLRVLGSGGMGIVFVAEDPDLQRRVALKVMKPVLAANPSARERFLREARSMAKLSHPRIVTIYQVGEDRGVPFLAMELLEGESLEVRLKRDGKLPVSEALRIGWEIAEGLAAAQQRGLIHRDIKPSNLWLEGASGHVKILDFGLARGSDEHTPLTLLGGIVGTPAYMAPEQARGEPIDRRSDLFSLGCVLYQLVAGEPPFRGSDPVSVLAAVVAATPRPVRQCNPDAPPAFAEVITRLLAKCPTERYPDAQAVLAALQAIESGSTPRRTRLTFGSARRISGLLLALLLGAGGTLGYYFAATHFGNEAGERPAPAGWHGLEQPADAGNLPQAAVLPELPPLDRNYGDGGFCHWALVHAVAVSSDGKRIASASADHAATVWDAHTGQVPFALCDHTDEILCIAFDRDNKRLVTGGKDNTLKLWDAERGKLLRDLPMGGWVQTAAFSPDGRLVGGMTPTALRLWEVDSGKEVFAADFDRDPLDRVGQGFAFSPNGKTLAHRTAKDGVRLIEMGTWQEQGRSVLEGQTVGCLAFGPDSKVLAVGCWGGEPAVTLWDVEGGTQRGVFRHDVAEEGVVGLAFTAGGRVLATAFNRMDWTHGDFRGSVRQWELDSDRQRPPIRPGPVFPGVFSLAYTPDGGTLVTAGRDGVVRRWDALTGSERPLPGGPFGYVHALALAPDGETVAVGCGSIIRLLDRAGGAERFQLRSHRNPVVDLAFSPDGASLASTALGGEVRLWDAKVGQEKRSWRHNGNALAFSAGSDLLATCGWGPGTIKLWDRRTGGEWLKVEQDGLNFSNALGLSPDGATLAAGISGCQPAILWDLSTGRRKLSLASTPANASASALAFSPDGKRLAVAHGLADPVTGLWDAATGRLRLVLTDCTKPVSSLAFAPDGTILATAGLIDGTVRLWATADGRPLRIFSLGPVGAHLLKLEYSADGRHLAVLNGNGTVSILRLNTHEGK